MNENEIYARASAIIDAAMGRAESKRGRRKFWQRNSDEDPLAHWAGVEAIVSLVTAATPDFTDDEIKMVMAVRDLRRAFFATGGIES